MFKSAVYTNVNVRLKSFENPGFMLGGTYFNTTTGCTQVQCSEIYKEQPHVL